ncbi:hypothetical protein GOB94_01405 [Granulicella sp. 5B5]|uniref:hypothetical protein n=1 Tax=Granulicella sp. 5B5 TaxID=1617967 RepID=UPI0015F6E294|nr:hypothetical protein [Granulicella sp. 5B5]QMV17512.1 hypothetical protein GOB94_01405 [Granulicella sp. 5B5]
MKLLAQIGATDWARGFKPRSCAGASCGRWLTERQLRVSHVGVTMEGVWYCSYRCILLDVEKALGKLVSPARRLDRGDTRTSIGMLLLRRNLLSEAQYKAAAVVHRETGQEMGDVLVELGFLGEGTIAEARAAQWACPVMSWEPMLYNASVRLPDHLIQRYAMAPVHLLSSSNRLFLGFKHGVEYIPLFAVEQITGYKVQPCILSSSDFSASLESRSIDLSYEERTFGDIENVRDMAGLLCEAGIEVDAAMIALVRCGSYIWGRLSGGSTMLDLLFDVA